MVRVLTGYHFPPYRYCQPSAPLADPLQELVYVVDLAGGVHPARRAVEALVDEELAPGHRAVRVPARVAGHLELGAEVEGGVRVDVEERVPVQRVLRGDGDPVGARGFPAPRWRRHGDRGVAVEGRQIPEVHAHLDVAPDRALGEGEGHPWLEAVDDARVHPWVRVQVVVEPVGERVHERPEPLGAPRVLGPGRVGDDEQLHAQVAPHLRGALGLGQSAHGVDIVGLDPVEVVLGLGVLHAEHGVRVRLAVHVGDAPVVAGDGDVGRLPLPPGQLLRGGVAGVGLGGGRRRREREGGRGDHEDAGERVHGDSPGGPEQGPTGEATCDGGEWRESRARGAPGALPPGQVTGGASPWPATAIWHPTPARRLALARYMAWSEALSSSSKSRP